MKFFDHLENEILISAFVSKYFLYKSVMSSSIPFLPKQSKEKKLFWIKTGGSIYVNQKNFFAEQDEDKVI